MTEIILLGVNKELMFGGLQYVANPLPGHCHYCILGDTWILDEGAVPNWTQVTPTNNPTPVVWGTLASDINGNIWLFGGCTAVNDSSSQCTAQSSQVWKWDNAHTNWVPSTPTDCTSSNWPRFASGMASGDENGQFVLFGGAQFPNNPMGDTCKWDGSNWSLQSSSGPSARVPGGMGGVVNCGSPSAGQTIVFDGLVNSDISKATSYVRDTWYWKNTSTGGSWSSTSCTTGGTPTARYAAATVAGGDGHIVAYGGYGTVSRACGCVVLGGGHDHYGGNSAPEDGTYDYNPTSP